MKRLPVRLFLPAMTLAVLALYLPRIALGDAALPTALSPARLDAIGSFAKLGSLGLGAFFGLRAARRLEQGNPARLPWMLLGLWLLGFTGGQAVLMSYPLLLGKKLPLPSLGDLGFLGGYLLMIAGSARFISVYRATGFPIGSPRQHLGIALGGAVVFAALGVPLLAPIARAEAPLGERLINLAYPVLDFVALVPSLVLIRITRALRGGKVAAVWMLILAGFVLMAAADVLFAYFSSVKVTGVEAPMDLAFVLGYAFAGSGMMLQDELLAE